MDHWHRDVLRMQLNPHFLFNTLHTVGSLVRHERNSEAIRMLAGLSDLLRHTLESVGTQRVTLKRELEFLERYLQIEQIRFQDRLAVNLSIDPQTLDALIPNLLLQPLVENAIRHGVARLSTAGVIEIRTKRANGMLEIEVHDDGPGLPAHWTVEQSKGVGVANTRARLEKLYGANHRFELRNAVEGGVTAIVCVPFTREDMQGLNSAKAI